MALYPLQLKQRVLKQVLQTIPLIKMSYLRGDSLRLGSSQDECVLRPTFISPNEVYAGFTLVRWDCQNQSRKRPPMITVKYCSCYLPLSSHNVVIKFVQIRCSSLNDRFWHIAELHSAIFIAIKRPVATGSNWPTPGAHASLFPTQRVDGCLF